MKKQQVRPRVSKEMHDFIINSCDDEQKFSDALEFFVKRTMANSSISDFNTENHKRLLEFRSSKIKELELVNSELEKCCDMWRNTAYELVDDNKIAFSDMMKRLKSKLIRSAIASFIAGGLFTAAFIAAFMHAM